MKATAVSENTEWFRRRALDRPVTPFESKSESLMREPMTAPPRHVTRRQLEVLCLLCEGLPNKLIARRLNISAATVKAHIGCILRGLGVASRLQAVVTARRMGLTGVPVCNAAQPGEPSLAGQTAILRSLEEMAARRLAATPHR